MAFAQQKKYYNDIFDSCLSDSKSTWKVINSVRKSNSKKKNETSLEINSESTSDPEVVANKFNEYFSSVVANIAKKIPIANVDPLSYISRKQNSFFFYETNPSEINQLIKGFNLRNLT